METNNRRLGRSVWIATAFAVGWIASNQAANAQAAPQNAVPPAAVSPAPGQDGKPPENVTVTAPTRPAPTANVLGVPVQADAPVSPSYDGTAYKTLGGQAETGQDAIAGQVMQPQGAGPH
jgi:hypothetical protein